MRHALMIVALMSALGCERTSGANDAAMREPAPSAATRVAANTPSALTTAGWPADQSAYQLGNLDSLRLKVPSCGVVAIPFTVDSVGPLHPGQTLGQVSARCPHGLAMWDWGDEGIRSPVLIVQFGTMTVRIALEDTLSTSHVTSLLSVDSTARTREGVGPGSTVAALERAYGALKYVEGECAVFATLPRTPGISFRLDLLKNFKCGSLEGDGDSHWRAPAGARVREMFVYAP